jgi:hypothetical protein
MSPGIGIQRLEALDPFAASLGRLGLFFLLLDAGFVIKPPLLDLGKEPLFSQFSLKVFDCLFDLIVANHYFHNLRTLSVFGLSRNTLIWVVVRALMLSGNKKSTSVVPEMLFPA